MRIKLPIFVFSFLFALVGIGTVTWYTYQAKQAHTSLSDQTKYLSPSESSLFAVSSLWNEYRTILSGRVSGRLTKDQADEASEKTRSQIDVAIKSLEKQLNSIPSTIQFEGIKPQKTIRDIKNSIALLKEGDEKILSVATPSSTSPDIRSYLNQYDEEGKKIYQTMTFFSTAIASISTNAQRSLTPLTSLWIIPLLIVCASCICMYWILVRIFTRSVLSLNSSLRETASISMPKDAPKIDDTLDTEEIISLIKKQIQEHTKQVEDISQQKSKETEAIKTGLEKIVEEQKREYEEKISELSTLNKSMVGRELKMAQLKQEIHTLKQKLGVHENTEG